MTHTLNHHIDSRDKFRTYSFDDFVNIQCCGISLMFDMEDLKALESLVTASTLARDNLSLMADQKG